MKRKAWMNFSTYIISSGSISTTSWRLKKRKIRKKEEKKESKKKVKTFDIKKFKDEIIITASALLALTNVNAFINTLQLKFYYPTSLVQDLLFTVGTGVAIGFVISKIRK